ncbi:eisosome protein SEG2-like isoform X3 [Apis florea]|uniref:eisosome protein SEG2-like isoform X3 n=1 Tax=Apis florea TaxID=7463 RepID=UPI0012FF04D3|nr:eisosome protein SEG2-like isoform X3 [Apis florea]
MVEIASCQDQVTGKPAIDCIGPGSFCCPDTFVKCYCEVNTVDGIMRATRLTEPCISIEGCIASNSGTFTFEGELDPGNSIDLDDVYENDDRERKLEDTLCYSDGTVGRVARRNLLQVQSVEDDYVARENSVVGGKRFKDERGYRSVLRRRLGDEANYRNQDEEDDLEDEDEDGDDEKRVFFAVARPEDDDDDDDDDEDTVNETEEPLGDYESTGGAKQIGLALELVAFSILFWFLEF